MSDTVRLYFAMVLGVSVCTALLAGLGPLLFKRPEGATAERIGVGVWVLTLTAWLTGAVWLATERALRPWHVVVAWVVALVMTRAGGPVARAIGGVPTGALVAFGVLRAGGAVRFLAMTTGWLPVRYAVGAGVCDVVMALGAVVIAARGGERATRAWSVMSLATLGLSWWWQSREVVPLPVFEGLYDGFLLPLFATAAVLAATRRDVERA